MPQVTGRVAQVVEFLPSKCEALRSRQGTAKKKKKKERKKKKCSSQGPVLPEFHFTDILNALSHKDFSLLQEVNLKISKILNQPNKSLS
jgi:hypothetical protein